MLEKQRLQGHRRNRDRMSLALLDEGVHALVPSSIQPEPSNSTSGGHGRTNGERTVRIPREVLAEDSIVFGFRFDGYHLTNARSEKPQTCGADIRSYVKEDVILAGVQKKILAAFDDDLLVVGLWPNPDPVPMEDQAMRFFEHAGATTRQRLGIV